MVKLESSVYLFMGQDIHSKEERLKKLKQESLLTPSIDFNSETIYAKETSLLKLQESLLYFPVNSEKRFLVLRGAQDLKEEPRKFLSGYVKNPNPKVILVIDVDRYNPKDVFLSSLIKYCQVLRFKEEKGLTTFDLSQQIDLKKPAASLKVLNQLLKDGEKPERILGGLRYNWENRISDPMELKKRIKLLLNCDLEIKTGKLKPAFALERFIVSLCSFRSSLG